MNKFLTITLLALSVCLIASLVGAQGVQPIKTWTDKPSYSVGDHATVLWDVKNQCVNVSGTQGYLSFTGPGTPGERDTLTESQVKSGSYTRPFPFDNSSVGGWIATMYINAPNCIASGNAMWQVGNSVPEFTSGPLVMFLGFVAGITLLAQRRRVKRHGK